MDPAKISVMSDDNNKQLDQSVVDMARLLNTSRKGRTKDGTTERSSSGEVEPMRQRLVNNSMTPVSVCSVGVIHVSLSLAMLEKQSPLPIRNCPK